MSGTESDVWAYLAMLPEPTRRKKKLADVSDVYLLTFLQYVPEPQEKLLEEIDCSKAELTARVKLALKKGWEGYDRRKEGRK